MHAFARHPPGRRPGRWAFDLGQLGDMGTQVEFTIALRAGTGKPKGARAGGKTELGRGPDDWCRQVRSITARRCIAAAASVPAADRSGGAALFESEQRNEFRVSACPAARYHRPYFLRPRRLCAAALFKRRFCFSAGGLARLLLLFLLVTVGSSRSFLPRIVRESLDHLLRGIRLGRALSPSKRCHDPP